MIAVYSCAPLAAFGLGQFIAAIIARLSDRKALFYPVAVMALALPVGGVL